MTNQRTLKRKLREAEDEYDELDIEYQQLRSERNTLKRKAAYFQEELAKGASPGQKFELAERLKEVQVRVDQIDARRDTVGDRLEKLEVIIEQLQTQLAGLSSPQAPSEVAPSGNNNVNTSDLRDKMTTYFAMHELRTLVFDMGIDFGELENTSNKPMTIISLIQYAQRHGRMDDLLVIARRERPNVDW